ncbi:transcriptional regulator [Lactobacillus delbrueckii subsp. delbrueckii DSM 20074 = JCM 1012]|uniref:TetR family transcriptional regulator n=1 Tax=Lactobacillus delbrueckii TaxID=1584 RepID=UPI0006EF1DC1|nr:TetR/AcrR family transcriptional regulator C-terminal domain-containing protein [Lactobacillus delbrueckii]KRK22108.1 transcriptional regulator [Lactobacillus delbrueckii subsp. delbrueckii DSM 20074 = JCM 1012]
MAKNGFNHVSVAKIMKQSGIRRQTFYENFKDKFDLLDYTIKSMMENDIESNIGYLDWEGIIFLVFYGIELNKKFYKSVYESQTEVDVVGEISSHIAVLLKQIVEEEGADFDQQAKDFVETFCLGLTYTMIDNLFRQHPLEYDVIASKVDNALHFTLNL